MASSDTLTSITDEQNQFQQHVVVMRHGDRMDDAKPLWTSTAERPWDPPLTDEGKVRAFCSGRKIRNTLGFPINRVFVSPFLRCIQTASEVVSALCAIVDSPHEMNRDKVSIDPSKVKVSIEYGLCEALSREAIRLDVAPKDGKFSFNIPELEAMLPAGTVDHFVERVYQELPLWEESMLNARARYERIFQALADKFPSENLLFVTHGEGVGTSVSTFLKDTLVYEVEYCAYSHIQRPISLTQNQNNFSAGNFELVTQDNQSGIRFCALSQ